MAEKDQVYLIRIWKTMLPLLCAASLLQWEGPDGAEPSDRVHFILPSVNAYENFVPCTRAVSDSMGSWQDSTLRARVKDGFCPPFVGNCSTEELHAIDDEGDPTKALHGPYAHLRAEVDFDHHRTYSKERQELQDSILTKFLEQSTGPSPESCAGGGDTTWMVFTAGAMGAGKTHTLRDLQNRGLFPLDKFVMVDPDDIRRLLPEFEVLVRHSPESAGALTRKEAGYISELLILAALDRHRHVLIDGSLRDWQWHKTYFRAVRERWTERNSGVDLKLAILHIVAPADTVYRRAEERAKTTGRVVPRATLERTMQQVPQSVQILSTEVDFFCELYNGDEVSGAEIVEPNITWQTFAEVWKTVG